ncbi:MAG: VWA domain-containing protein [Acidobacteriota bacterium]
MKLLEPIWLALAIPLALATGSFRPPTRWLRALRAAVLACAVLAMTRPVLDLATAGGTVVIVADRSLSMPPGAPRLEREVIDRVRGAARSADRVAVVSFGATAALEPEEAKAFTADVGPSESALAPALSLSLAQIPAGLPGRLLVLSDGRYTGSDPAGVAAEAAVRGIAIDHVAMKRGDAGDVAIASLEAPTGIHDGEGFLATAWIQCPARQEVAYELRRGPVLLARGTETLDAGLSPLSFRDRAIAPGTFDLTLTVRGSGADPVPENNRARALVTARGKPRVLHVAADRASGLATLLARGGLDADVVTPAEADLSLAHLGPYAAVILENVPATQLSTAGLEDLAAWVENGAGGLLVTGGRRSFATGGYYRSPLDPILPVSMELRRENRKLSLAVAIALDRSGSMAVPVDATHQKMDLADLAAAEVVNLLSPIDEVGVIAVDSVAHEVVPLQRLHDPASVQSRIRSINSQGGGIYIYEALLHAASMLSTAQAGTRHVILFADAADSEEPGDYKTLLTRCTAAGMTVSVVGLGTPKDPDADLLRDIARRGGGEVYFSDDARELPRLFAQDTFTVARSAFVPEKTQVKSLLPLATILGRSLGAPPQIGGYNLCYARPGALTGIVTEDENAAPIVAAWQFGAGRVACYTGEAAGESTGEMARWPQAADLLAGLCRYAMTPENPLTESMAVTQDVEHGTERIRLHVDPEGRVEDLPRSARTTVAQRGPDGELTLREEPLRWLTPDTLGADVPLRGEAPAIATVVVDGAGRATLPPVCLPYSPEVAPEAPAEDTLRTVSHVTGGSERLDPSSIWQSVPRQPHDVELAPLLGLVAAALLFLEVLERRMSAMSWLLSRSLERIRIPRLAAPARELKPFVATPSPAARPSTPDATPPPELAVAPPQAPTPEAPASPLMDALSEARAEARRRTRKS